MTAVNVFPIPEAYRGLRFQPMPPPIFSDDDPAADDIALARELFQALDTESQHWYRSYRIFADLVPHRCEP